MAKALKGDDRDVEPKPQKLPKKARKAKKAKKKKHKKHALARRTVQWLEVRDPEAERIMAQPLPVEAERLDVEVDGTGVSVSEQFVREFLRYMATQFVDYDRFPALVQHILLMRRHVAITEG